MDVLAFAVVIAAIIIAMGMGLASRRIMVAAAGLSGSLLVRESVPQMYSDDPEELEENLQWVESNIHLPPWAERQQTSFGEALVYQVARLAAAQARLAAAVERLGPIPSEDTQAGPTP
jgi:hypothetical protein